MLSIGCAQKKAATHTSKRVLTQELSEIPTFPGCEKYKDWIEKEFCITNSIQQLIAKKARTENLVLERDTLTIGIRIETDGSTTIRENKSSNKKLEELSKDVLTHLPYIEPAYSKVMNAKVTAAYSFYVLFVDNRLKSLWEK